MPFSRPSSFQLSAWLTTFISLVDALFWRRMSGKSTFLCRLLIGFKWRNLGHKGAHFSDFSKQQNSKNLSWFYTGKFFPIYQMLLFNPCSCFCLIWVEGKVEGGGVSTPLTLLVFLECFRNSKSCSPVIVHHSETFFKKTFLPNLVSITRPSLQILLSKTQTGITHESVTWNLNQ